MKREINIAGMAVLQTGQLRKTGGNYALVRLSPEHIDAILKLEDAAFAALTKEEASFLLKKDRAFFEAHFAQGNSVLGIVHNGALIAQSVILNPSARYPKTGMADMPELAGVKAEAITIQQGVIVAPAYRGNQLMDVMVGAWVAEAQKAGKTEAISEVATGNSFSWDVYLKNGFHVESIGTDSADGTRLYNMHGHLPDLAKAFNAAAARKKTISCPQGDLAQQQKLLAQGYKGVSFDAANDTLQFRKRAKKAPCL
jgi:hypothetical protein